MAALDDRTAFYARRIDLYIPQGATYNRAWLHADATGAPINITGYTARLQIREYQAATAVLYSATTENGEITLSGVTGLVQLKIPANITAAWAFSLGEYDLELVAPLGETTKLGWGRVQVRPEVTR